LKLERKSIDETPKIQNSTSKPCS